ncbi:MAG: archease [Methanomicrobiales archaeon]|nr:archease [Methanomicrobiales archaeon]
MSFEELDHTADVLMRIRGATLRELFSDAGRAMFHVMYGPCEDRGIVRQIALEAEDLESLLIDYLSELLFIADAESLVFCSFDVDLQGNQLSVTLRGEPFDLARHTGGALIKGISYFGLEIVKEKDVYMVDIIFDI